MDFHEAFYDKEQKARPIFWFSKSLLCDFSHNVYARSRTFIFDYLFCVTINCIDRFRWKALCIYSLAMPRTFPVTVVFVMVILQNINTSLQATCPTNCHCDEDKRTVSCQGIREDLIEESGLPMNTQRLSLTNMKLASDENLKNVTRRLRDLLYLNISQNAFTRLPIKTIGSLKKLATLIMQNNLISELPLELLDVVSNNSINFDLTGNPLSCTCETVYVVKNHQKYSFYGRCVRPLNILLGNLSAELLTCKPCINERCSLRGKCVSQNILNFTCNCFLGYTGRYCESSVLTNCPINICQNGGSCHYKEEQNLATCTCVSGTSGEICEKDEKADQLNADIIIALVISVFVLLIVVLIICYFWHLRPNNRRRAEFWRNSGAGQPVISGRVVKISNKVYFNLLTTALNNHTPWYWMNHTL